MSGDQTRRWALVVGGSGAIGSAICRELGESGWNVAVTYHRNPDSAEQTCTEVEQRGGSAVAVRMDLTDADQVAEAVASATGSDEPLAGVVYAAGPFFRMEYISKLSPATFQDTVLRDTIACYNVLQPSVSQLRQSKGSIVALTTSANRRYLVSDLLSTAPKAAIESIVKGIAAEEARHGVRANIVGVGVIDAGIWTRMADELNWTAERLEKVRKGIPLGRLGVPDDVAAAVGFLMSVRASYISGQFLDVDGGVGI
jgi:3-oxoacyl-[acyl-carrier protein] reductase